MIVKKDFIAIFKSIDLSTRQLPVLIAETDVPGPTVVLTAAIHGDEVTGIAVIQSLFKRLEKYPLLKGRLFTIPILNPTGFETISRYEGYAEEDLNRYFDGDPEGSTPERLAAHILTQILEVKPDYVIDLHTDSMNSIAYTLVDLPTDLKQKEALEKSIEIAKTLGFAWAIDTFESAGYEPQKCLTGQLMSRGVPAVTVELGGPMVVIEEFRKLGLEAIWRFLVSQDMVGKKESADILSSNDDVFTFAERVRTQMTGIIDYRVRPGDRVVKDQLIGKVRNVFGETIEMIKSPVDGVVYSHEDQSVTFPGQTLFTIATVSTLAEILTRSGFSIK